MQTPHLGVPESLELISRVPVLKVSSHEDKDEEISVFLDCLEHYFQAQNKL